MATRFSITIVALVMATLTAPAAAAAQQVIAVRERDGVYTVTARFAVPDSATAVREVLS